MNIEIRNLGAVSEDEKSKAKFILLESGVLLFGRVQWHKDLALAAGIDEQIKIIGAGVVPESVKDVELQDEAWGGWKSTGYDVITPVELRTDIRNALVESA